MWLVSRCFRYQEDHYRGPSHHVLFLSYTSGAVVGHACTRRHLLGDKTKTSEEADGTLYFIAEDSSVKLPEI